MARSGVIFMELVKRSWLSCLACDIGKLRLTLYPIDSVQPFVVWLGVVIVVILSLVRVESLVIALPLVRVKSLVIALPLTRVESLIARLCGRRC